MPADARTRPEWPPIADVDEIRDMLSQLQGLVGEFEERVSCAAAVDEDAMPAPGDVPTLREIGAGGAVLHLLDLELANIRDSRDRLETALRHAADQLTFDRWKRRTEKEAGDAS